MMVLVRVAAPPIAQLPTAAGPPLQSRVPEVRSLPYGGERQHPLPRQGSGMLRCTAQHALAPPRPHSPLGAVQQPQSPLPVPLSQLSLLPLATNPRRFAATAGAE
jgi:hypothetical protein